MISYIRRNLVAFVALFVAIVLSGGSVAYAANTIRSSDIVDGQVMNADLAANAVGNGKIQDGSVLGADIKDNSLSGLDIKESTLGQVPNAKTLDGSSVDMLRHYTQSFTEETDECTVVNVWAQCDAFAIVVPAGHEYVVNMISTVTANPGATASVLEFCPAKTGPTCFNGDPDDVSLPANQFTNASSAASVTLGAGSYDTSTAVHVLGTALLHTNRAHTTTTVDIYDFKAIKHL